MLTNQSLLTRYGIAVLLIGLACVITMAIPSLREHDPYLLFFVAVMLTLWTCRLGPGILAIVMSVPLLDYFFLEPLYEFGLSWDQTVVVGTFSLVALMIHSFQIHRDRLERMVHHTEDVLGLAQKIQRNLFPKSPMHLPGFDVAGTCNPADATGGDYFDFIPIPQATLGIGLGDVSGHGFGPALVMAEMHAYVRALALRKGDPGEILTLANRLIHDDTQDNQFVTVFLGVLNPANQTLVYASAGQQGFLMDPAGKVRNLDSTGLPLGVDPTEVFQCAPAVALEEGSLVILITDGVFEAMGADRKQFGVQRAFDVIRGVRERSAEEISKTLCQAVSDYMKGAPASDDVTVVIVKNVGGAA